MRVTCVTPPNRASKNPGAAGTPDDVGQLGSIGADVHLSFGKLDRVPRPRASPLIIFDRPPATAFYLLQLRYSK
jgi:hypothetical protein